MNTKKSVDDQDLDSIFQELGEFGKFQKINYFFISIPIFLLAGVTLSYVFTAGNLEYRCKIPQCDNENQTDYSPNWIQYAIPYHNGKPAKCRQYAYQANISDVHETEQCSIHNFNTSEEIVCNELIYKNDEVTIVNEFNITCEENEWKLAMIGSINNIAQFIFMPIAGFVSDRFGRRTVFLCGILCSTFFGLMRSLATNYYMFAAAEFFDAGLGSGTYGSAFILGLELVGPSKRVMGSVILSCSYAIGEALLAIMAMYVQHFRIILRIIYLPAILVVSYFWLIPESVRWLLITGQKEKATKILLKAAKTNNVVLSDGVMQKLHDNCSMLSYNEIQSNEKTDQEKKSENYPIFEVLKSKILVIRVIICSYCWLTNTLVYYGLGLNAVALAGNKYMNFCVVSLVEIPGYLIAYFLMERYGRRQCLCGSLLICGLSCAVSEFLPADAGILKLAVFLIGKCAITVSFTVLYIYTAELYPTNLRHSLLASCSMVGRIGSIIAPQTPLLAKYMQSLPLLIFSGTAITSGLFILQFPETFNTKLPDTIEEAENISKLNRKKLPEMEALKP